MITEFAESRPFEYRVDVDRSPQYVFGSRDRLHRADRISPEPEEVIVEADGVTAQQITPDLG
jgi:hypothetical protein